MFAKDRAKPILTETYEEAELVESERESIKDYPEQSREKGAGRKSLLFTKPKEEKSPYLENMAKMMQKLSNKIIDLEKEKETIFFYRPYYKKREDNNQSQPPPHNTASMNLTEVGMDNFCTFHQQPHSEKNCPQWINSMTLVMNQLLDSRLTEDGEEERKEKTTSTRNRKRKPWLCGILFHYFMLKRKRTRATRTSWKPTWQQGVKGQLKKTVSSYQRSK